MTERGGVIARTLSKTTGDEAIPISFLTEPVLSPYEVFGMRLRVRLLHGIYTGFIEIFAMMWVREIHEYSDSGRVPRRSQLPLPWLAKEKNRGKK